MSEFKACRKCLAPKLPEEFGVSKHYKSGRSTKCKECECAEARERYHCNAEYREQIKEYRRKRKATGQNYQDYRRHYDKRRLLGIKREISPEKAKAYREKYREAYAEKNRVRAALRNAMLAGRIQKNPCMICGSQKSHAHHEDYAKPFEVVWLCPPHHGAWHRLFIGTRRSQSNSQKVEGE